MAIPYLGVAETKKIVGRHGRRYRRPMANLIERHAQKIVGVLSCFDRLVLQGTLPNIAYPQAMATELDRRNIRMFDYAKEFAQLFRDAIRAHTERLAAEEGVQIENIQRAAGER